MTKRLNAQMVLVDVLETILQRASQTNPLVAAHLETEHLRGLMKVVLNDPGRRYALGSRRVIHALMKPQGALGLEELCSYFVAKTYCS